jgi:hypothetical protein
MCVKFVNVEQAIIMELKFCLINCGKL